MCKERWYGGGGCVELWLLGKKVKKKLGWGLGLDWENKKLLYMCFWCYFC